MFAGEGLSLLFSTHFRFFGNDARMIVRNSTLMFAGTFLVTFAIAGGTGVAVRQLFVSTDLETGAVEAERVPLAPPAIATVNPPRLEIDVTTVDAGPIMAGPTQQYVFALRNTGIGPLLLSTKAGCGCTLVEHVQEIPAGGQGQIIAQLKTTNLSEKFQKTIELRTNDPQQPKTQLVLTGRIVPAVELVAPEKMVMPLHMEGPTEQECTLRGRGIDNVQILAATTDQDFVSTRLEQADVGSKGNEYQLILTVSPHAPLGKSMVQLVLSTTCETEPQVLIPIRLEKGIIVSPATVRFAATASDKLPVSRTVMLTKLSGEFHIRSLSASEAGLGLKAEPVKEGSSYRLVVTLREPMTQSASAMVTVFTDDPHQEAVQFRAHWSASLLAPTP